MQKVNSRYCRILSKSLKFQKRRPVLQVFFFSTFIVLFSAVFNYKILLLISMFNRWAISVCLVGNICA